LSIHTTINAAGQGSLLVIDSTVRGNMINTSAKLLQIGALFLLLVASSLFHPNHADAKRIVRAAIYNFKPLVYSDPDGSPQGFFVKMLNRVADREQWEVQYVPGTWQEGMDRLKKNEVDLVLCIGYTQERAAFLDFPREFLVLDWGLVYKSKRSHIDNIMDLDGKTVSGLRGSVFSTGFLELVKQFQIKVNFIEADQMSDVFKAVDSGKAAAGVTSNIPGILNEAAYLVDRTSIIFTPVKLGFAVNGGKNSDLIAALDRNIAAMKADQGSAYYRELGHLFGKKDAVIPKEVYWALSGISAVLLWSISFIIVLRRKVRLKTAELSEQAGLMRAIINGTTDAVFIKDTKGCYVVVNDEVVRLFGRERAEIIGKDDTIFFPPQEARFLMSKDQAIMGGKEVVTGEEHITTLEGARTYLSAKGPVYNKQGALAGMFGISRDITGFRRAETESFRYSQLLKRTGEIALVGGWEFDLETGKLFWSELMYRIHEVDADFIVTPESAYDFYPPETRPVVQAAVNALVKSGTAFDLELAVVSAKGNALWVRGQGEAEYLDGRITKIFGSFQNITERKRMEEQLRQSNEQLHFVLEGSQLGFWDWNMEAGEVARNERWAEMLGYTLKEVELTINQWTTLMHPDDKERAWKSVNDHLEGRAALHEVEYRMLAKDGGYKWIYDRACIVKRDAEGRPARMSGTHTDITERKRVEEEKQSLDQQMQHAQRLESLGVLSGGIAHDFNNILAIIIGHCALAKLNPRSAENSLGEIERAAERAAELCRQMLAYAGKSQFIWAKVNFGELVEDIVKMLKTTISQKVEIRSFLAPETSIIDGDASQLRQIAMNLIINASEAIGKEHGEIRVSVAHAELAEGGSSRDYLGKTIAPGSYVSLTVSDNGCGMDSETLMRIFEPFYTTKFTGRGLGMSAVLGIITSHKGALQLFSEPGRGTTFTVYLPLLKGGSGEGDATLPAVSTAPWQSSGTVLLVEDECQIRIVVKSLLESFGLTVLEAGNGKEALELYESHAGEITLVVTDMGMPVMDGHDLCLALQKHDPKLPIIISSGFGDADVASRVALQEIAGVISKPYSIDQLQEILMKVVPAAAK
jgi:PAS domain S-box-containing protein